MVADSSGDDTTGRRDRDKNVDFRPGFGWPQSLDDSHRPTSHDVTLCASAAFG
jgi:hypothetical protein